MDRFGGISCDWSRRRRVALASCASAAVLAAAGAAQAETATAQVGEVIVTAQRRSERLEQVPMAVTVLSGETLGKAGVVGMQDINRIAAGVQVNFGGAFTAPAIRGVTSLTTGTAVENNVAVYIDGFYQPDNVSINTDLANIASIEVLKGPQGTLYGRNATGGAILINTLAPSKTLTGRIEAGYARFNDRSISGYLSGPISDRVRYSLAGYLRKSDGYIKKVASDGSGRLAGDAAPIDQQSVRAKVEADLTDNLTATLGFNYAYVDDPRGLMYSAFQYVPPFIPVSARAPRFGTAAYQGANDMPIITSEGTVKLAYRTPAGTLTSYTGFAHRKLGVDFDFDGSYAELTNLYIRYGQDTFQQAVDYNITAIEHFDLVVGGLYVRDNTESLPNLEATTRAGVNGPILQKQFFGQTTKAYAAYVDGTFHVTEALAINLGGRYSHESKDAYFANVAGSGATIFPPTTRKISFNRFTPRASIRYEVAPRSNLYAAWSQGFRSGAFSASGAATPALFTPTRPEKITAYEVGFKTAQRRFRFDVAAFYYDYTDLQVSVLVNQPGCTSNCSLVQVFSNAKAAEIYGVDGQATFELTDALTIRAGGAWLHARYSDFRNAPGTGLNAATGLNVGGQLQDWSGQQMARAPTFSGNLSADYDTRLASGDLLLSGTLSYTDSFVLYNASLYGPLAPAALASKQRYRQGAYALVSARAVWTDAGDHVRVTVFGNNLTNKKYRMTYSGGSFGDYSAQATPFTWGVKLGYSF
jgi:iron complex outermembrane receptor protein